jgi:hypothetical protein
MNIVLTFLIFNVGVSIFFFIDYLQDPDTSQFHELDSGSSSSTTLTNDYDDDDAGLWD